MENWLKLLPRDTTFDTTFYTLNYYRHVPRNFNEIESIFFYAPNLKCVSDEIFEPLQSLKTIWFSNRCAMVSLSSNLPKLCPLLTSINVSFNQLQTIPRGFSTDLAVWIGGNPLVLNL